MFPDKIRGNFPEASSSWSCFSLLKWSQRLSTRSFCTGNYYKKLHSNTKRTQKVERRENWHNTHFIIELAQPKINLICFRLFSAANCFFYRNSCTGGNNDSVRQNKCWVKKKIINKRQTDKLLFRWMLCTKWSLRACVENFLFLIWMLYIVCMQYNLCTYTR